MEKLAEDVVRFGLVEKILQTTGHF